MVCAVQSMCCVQKYMHNCKLILWVLDILSTVVLLLLWLLLQV